MGQPILVGHHSEGRHRRDLKRIDNNMRKSVEESEKVDYFQSRVSTLKYEVNRNKGSRDYFGNRIKKQKVIFQNCKGKRIIMNTGVGLMSTIPKFKVLQNN